MTRRSYGWVAGFIGAGLGAWYWHRRSGGQRRPVVHDRGRVIFDNTPQPSGTEPL